MMRKRKYFYNIKLDTTLTISFTCTSQIVDKHSNFNLIHNMLRIFWVEVFNDKCLTKQRYLLSDDGRIDYLRRYVVDIMKLKCRFVIY